MTSLKLNLLAVFILIIFTLIFVAMVHGDYVQVPHKRLIDVTDWQDIGQGVIVKVIYDQDGKVDCYVTRSNYNSAGEALACIQK